MSVQLVETETHVFEVVTTPDTPGRCRRQATVRVLSGWDLTNEEWQRVAETLVRAFIAAGNRVYAIQWGLEGDDDA